MSQVSIEIHTIHVDTKSLFFTQENRSNEMSSDSFSCLSASPKNTTCTSFINDTDQGSTVSINCKTWAFPEATSVWKLPNGTAIYSERMHMFTTTNQVSTKTMFLLHAQYDTSLLRIKVVLALCLVENEKSGFLCPFWSLLSHISVISCLLFPNVLICAHF